MLWNWIPQRLSVYSPSVLFTTQEHGTSPTTLFNILDELEHCILVVKTFDNQVIANNKKNKTHFHLFKLQIYFHFERLKRSLAHFVQQHGTIERKRWSTLATVKHSYSRWHPRRRYSDGLASTINRWRPTRSYSFEWTKISFALAEGNLLYISVVTINSMI